MNIIYDKNTGYIYSAISDDQYYKNYYSQYPQEFIDNLECLLYEEKLPINLSEYFVENESLIKYLDSELKEKNRYGKILTEEERILEQLKPSDDEVKKAQTTIEILSLLQEVL